jgi:hypothetical protein
MPGRYSPADTLLECLEASELLRFQHLPGPELWVQADLGMIWTPG